MRELIEAADEIDGFQVLVAAVLIGDPFTCSAGVIEVDHGSHGIHAEAVNVVLLEPEQRVGNEKLANFVPAEVKNERSPIAMLALSRIGVLVESGAVEV